MLIHYEMKCWGEKTQLWCLGCNLQLDVWWLWILTIWSHLVFQLSLPFWDVSQILQLWALQQVSCAEIHIHSISSCPKLSYRTNSNRCDCSVCFLMSMSSGTLKDLPVGERGVFVSKGGSRMAVRRECAGVAPPHWGRYLRSLWLKTLVLLSFSPFRFGKITWLGFHWDLNFGHRGKALRSASVYPQMAIAPLFLLMSLPQREGEKFKEVKIQKKEKNNVVHSPHGSGKPGVSVQAHLLPFFSTKHNGRHKDWRTAFD